MKKTFRKTLVIALTLSLVTGMAGCETMTRKFTRKKKDRPVRPMFYKEGQEEKKPAVELYIMHYIYWQTWMDDLINNAGTNAKRDERAANEAMSNITDMRSYLAEEKAKELDEYIDELKRITDQIRQTSLMGARAGKLRQDLDRVKRRVSGKFQYKKVQEFVKERD